MTVYKRTSWYYRFYHQRGPYQKGGFPTKRAAGDAETLRRLEVGAESHRRRAVTVEEAVEAYLKEVVPHHKNQLGERYTFSLFVERFATRPLHLVTAGDIEGYKAWRLSTPGGLGRQISRTTVNRDLAHLSAFFNWCQRRGWLPEHHRNPARATAVKRYEEPWRPWIILTAEQQEKLWSLLPSKERVKAQLLKHLGVRMGVVLNLRWEQIDWANRLIHYTSKRHSDVIPLNDTVIGLLKALGPKPSGRIFPQRTASTLKKWWAKARQALGLPELRRHDLRVTYARELAGLGADLKTIQGLLGHSTIVMTSRYIPSDLGARRRAVRLLDKPTPPAADKP